VVIRLKFYKTVKAYNGLVSDFWSEELPVVSHSSFLKSCEVGAVRCVVLC
jgi:hypothetical protein